MATLGKLNLLPPEDLEVGSSRLTSAVTDAQQTLHGKGLLPVGMPAGDYKGEMPQDLTSLDDEELGDLLNHLSAWCAYVDYELAQASAQRDASNAALETSMARVRLAYKTDEEGRKLTVQEKTDLVLNDPRVNVAQSKALYCETLYTLTRVYRETAQRNWETVSRRITQRGQEVDRMKRQSNVAGVPASATRTFRRPV
jgi:hypothetical protein